MKHYDLCVIGSGPGGQKAAIQASKLGKTVCVVERMEVVGGVAINTGTIPSKALRESVLTFTRGKEPLAVRSGQRGDQQVSIDELLESCNHIVEQEIEIVKRHMRSNGIDLYQGVASFEDEKTVFVKGHYRQEHLTADKFIVAVGTVPARPDDIPFDDDFIITSDEVLNLKRLPKTMIVVGGGVIGTEYASMFAELGVRVTLIETRNELIPFVDREVREALQYHLRNLGMTLRFNEEVVSIGKIASDVDCTNEEDAVVAATMESGKTLKANCLLYCVGRQGATDNLNLSAVGLEADKRGRIKVDYNYKSENPDVYAVGDVVGFPALASTSMDQGRVAACNMYNHPTKSVPLLFPYGVYAIPEISMVGKTEERLTKEAIPFESGIAQYKEIARGQIIGDNVGMLKMLIHQDTHEILGIHAIGTGATELIHIGQAVMAFGGTVEYFINTVFNYPTLAECYKVAALNGLNKLHSI